jgi:hypothetical protein
LEAIIRFPRGALSAFLQKIKRHIHGENVMRRPSRRQFIQLGGIGLFDLSLPQLLSARGTNNREGVRATADACVLVFLGGGPSHLDMWDPKPDAPEEIRGPFKSITTRVTGVRLSEHLPKLAEQLHRCAIVRSAHHTIPNHVPGIYQALTGHPRPDPEKSSRPSGEDYPSIGSVLNSRRPSNKTALPFVWLSEPLRIRLAPQSGLQSGWLGAAHDPFLLRRDPAEPDFSVLELTPPTDSLTERRRLLNSLDGCRADLKESRPGQQMAVYQEKAFDLLTSPNTRKAFEIDREPSSLRDAYGREGEYGQRLLLTRRLIEAGTRMVCVSGESIWDTHNANFKRLKDTLLPDLDSALGTFLKDMADHALLDRTLVVVMGEFGRTPRIGQGVVCGAGADGRDHWCRCYSILLAGGGINPGIVYGSSDRIGALPSSNPVTPADLVATIYSCLGIPHDLELRDAQNRPTSLVPWGQPVSGLLA